MKKDIIYIAPNFMDIFSKKSSFNFFMSLSGIEYRNVAGRQTLQVKMGKGSFFIKKHLGITYKEIFKNLISFKLPIIGAKNEWLAIKKLNTLDISTTPWVAFGEEKKISPIKRSFIVTKDLGDICSLEDYCKNWIQYPPTTKIKNTLIDEVAKLSGIIHSNGINHRDFYLCHICIDNTLLKSNICKLYLIDLHRVGIANSISKTDQMKDLAALYFSAMHIGLTRKDILRFIVKYRNYFNGKSQHINPKFLEKINERSIKLDKKYHSKWPGNVQ
jgi:heptose I phosphotransferase